VKIIAFNGSARKDGNTAALIKHVISQMVVPGSSYWNIGAGREKGDVEKDDEGLRTMTNLGRNMAWLLQKLAVK